MGFKTRTGSRPALFTDATMQFLVDLYQNNNREWFAANKARYEELVREPALRFIQQMAPHVAAVSAHLTASDKRVGGSLMRVYRDTRFARDKTPYKTNIGIQFRHRAGKNVHAPGLYVHIALDGCFLGAGSWRPEPESLARIRKRIVDQPDAWIAARDDKAFRRHFRLSGETLKRMPRGFDDDHPNAADVRRTDHIAIADVAIDDVLSPRFVRFCARRFAAARPYLRFLTHAVAAPF